MKVTELLEAMGHKEIRATHPTTFEFTRERHLTWRGDCIIGVMASKAASDLSDEFKAAARRMDTVIRVRMEVEGVTDEASGRGHPSLSYTDVKSLVARRSGYVCGRTLMIHSNKAAKDLSRALVDLMRSPKARMEIILTAETAD
ncbi:MAG: DUF371 domain-containing protein [Candidatus Bathyarchaeia archaeon]|nr:DUF371 domain-containing protein [Candidatus Bathyarchaeota archaeon]